MLKQPMIEKLAAMRLVGMAEALKAQEQDPSARAVLSAHQASVAPLHGPQPCLALRDACTRGAGRVQHEFFRKMVAIAPLG